MINNNDIDLIYQNSISAMNSRRRTSLNKILSELRAGKEAYMFASYSVIALDMPEDMLTEEDIKTANAAVRLLTTYRENNVALRPGGDTAKGRGEIDFVAIRLAKLLYTEYPERLEPETLLAIKDFFLNENFESIHYSENHMLLFRASRYIAACYYEGEFFNQYSMKSEDLARLEHDYLVSYIKFRARRGFAEFNSIEYEEHNFNTLLALYDCSKDEDLRRLSSMMLDTMLLNMLANTTENGVCGGAHGRAYDYAIRGVDIGMYDINRLYFALGDFENHNFDIPIIIDSAIMSSKWIPDISVYSVYREKAKSYPFSSYERVHNHTLGYEPLEFGTLNKYTYNTPHYSIGSVNQQDDFPDWADAAKYAWYQEMQQTNFSLTFASNPKAGITVHHPGTSGLHAYWYGDQGCNCNHLFGHGDTVIGLFHAPTINATSLDFIHANIHKRFCDELIEEPERCRLFVKIADAYAALTFSHPYVWSEKNPEREIIIRNDDPSSINIAFACQAGDITSYGSFEKFIAAVKSKEFSYNSKTFALKYGSMMYEYLPGGEERQYLNGERVNSIYDCTYNSPFMKSRFDSGVIEVYFGNEVRIMSFADITDTTKKKI